MSKRPRGQNRAMNPDPARDHIRDPSQDRDIAEQRSENAAQPDEQPATKSPESPERDGA